MGAYLAAQNLIRDFINGVLIIVEDQYNVNDWIQIRELPGNRQALHCALRACAAAKPHHHPQQHHQDVINYTKDWSYHAIYVTIPYEGDYAAAKKY